MSEIDCTMPPWLRAMRAITGLAEDPSSGDNPKIMAMRDWIACMYPEMYEYCLGYTGDDVAWCGLCSAWCCTISGIKPPFGSTDEERFLWARSFSTDPNFEHLNEPILGCIVVMTRDGGGHVTMYEETKNGMYMCRGGNQSNEVNVQAYDPSTVIALCWPKDAYKPPQRPERPGRPGDDEQEEIRKGDSGEDVEHVQMSLGLPIDGDFGTQTDAGVRGFQVACDLDADGVVGSNTWERIDKLDHRMRHGGEGLQSDEETIIEMAINSAIAHYPWEDRGAAPPGYTPGIALTFALALEQLQANNAPFLEMAQEDRGDTDTDVLSYYREELRALGIDTSNSGVECLRAVFVVLMGLGPRETSGNHWCGRDQSASNTDAMTCEAGLFQSSWNLSSVSANMGLLLDQYWLNPSGFQHVFTEGLDPDPDDLRNYGYGQGAQYQWLAKYAPAFACFTTAIGLRLRRQHWGPINRGELELRPEANALLLQIQRFVMDDFPEEDEADD